MSGSRTISSPSQSAVAQDFANGDGIGNTEDQEIDALGPLNVQPY